jgi:hypothetical protein
MKSANISRLVVMAALLATTGIASPLAPSGEIFPANGDLTGAPGDTVTWSVSLINTDALNWWAISSVQSTYLPNSGVPGDIPAADPNFFHDDLSDYFLNAFVLNGTGLAPGQDINLLSPGDPVSLASYMISPTATAGTVTGTLSIFYDIFDGNPYDANNPGNYLGTGEFDVDTSVTAAIQGGGGNNGGQGPVTPEPGTVVMCATGLASLIVLHKRRQKSTAPKASL